MVEIEIFKQNDKNNTKLVKNNLEAGGAVTKSLKSGLIFPAAH